MAKYPPSLTEIDKPAGKKARALEAALPFYAGILTAVSGGHVGRYVNSVQGKISLLGFGAQQFFDQGTKITGSNAETCLLVTSNGP